VNTLPVYQLKMTLLGFNPEAFDLVALNRKLRLLK